MTGRTRLCRRSQQINRESVLRDRAQFVHRSDQIVDVNDIFDFNQRTMDIFPPTTGSHTTTDFADASK